MGLGKIRFSRACSSVMLSSLVLFVLHCVTPNNPEYSVVASHLLKLAQEEAFARAELNGKFLELSTVFVKKRAAILSKMDTGKGGGEKLRRRKKVSVASNTTATAHRRAAAHKYTPIADAPCYGQKPCLHTSAPQRIASGCMTSIWQGTWLDATEAQRLKAVQGLGKSYPMNKLGLSNRFRPRTEEECDVADVLQLSASADIEKSLTDAKERHLLQRLKGVRNRVWLTFGTSVDHRMTRMCPLLAGTPKTTVMDDLDSSRVFNFCVLPALNLTIIYTFQDGLCSTMQSRNASLQRAKMAGLHSLMAAKGWPQGPDFVTLAGVEWDFKHWADSHARPDFDAAPAALALQTASVRYQWPMVKGIFLRNHYQADRYTFSNQQIVRYNAVLSGFAASKKHDMGKHLPCGQLFYADMASLMRHNGTKKSGWTDGMHPAAWVTFAYLSLSVNALADLGEACP